MIKKKSYDGVVTAVRYTSQGEIDWVRAFERRGFVFTDRVNLKRESLMERLMAGKRFKTGSRILYKGSDFEVYEDIKVKMLDFLETEEGKHLLKKSFKRRGISDSPFRRV